MGGAVRPSADSLLRQLAGRGYSIFSFSVASTGDYAVADADWNYKDIPHLNVVHTQVRGILATIDDDMVTNIFLQRVAGIPLPIVVVNYAESDVAQSYFTSFGPYVLVVRTQYEAEGPNRTKVTTTYNIAASGIWRLGLPLLKRILTKNYHTLMSEDTPMRDRRGELRARGFRFRTDGSPRAFPETAHLTIDNLIVPERTEASAFRVQLSELAEDGADVLVGENDDRGARLLRRNGRILLMPRICSHEGANLDCAAEKNGKLLCPWHAKSIAPLLAVDAAESVRATKGAYAIQIDGQTVEVTLPR